MQIGLLGKANVGKSTFFSAATETPAASGNFPFTTIKPNVGVAYARTGCACRHFKVEHENPLCIGGTRLVPVGLIDVAGLVPGAHEGKGLGNQFLDDARQAEALIHIVDASGSTDIQGQPVPPGTHDPAEDVAFVQDEFDMWFADILRRDWDRITRETDQKRAKLADCIAQRFSGLGIRDSQVQDALRRLGLGSKSPKEWADSDMEGFVRGLRQDAKPMVISANKADLCGDPGAAAGIGIPCSAEAELILRKASKAGIIRYAPGDPGFEITAEGIPAPQKKALDTVRSVLSKIPSTGVQAALDRAVFGLLGLIVVYPVEDETRLASKDGAVLPDAKLLRPGSTARDLAGLVHADIARGFLHAIDCKTGQRISGEQELRDGDVVKIVSAQGRG